MSQTRTLSTSTPSSNTPKRFHTMAKAFRGTVVRDWLDVDDNLYRVFNSISNLRDRCVAISRRKESFKAQDSCLVSSHDNDEWRAFGYRGRIHHRTSRIKRPLDKERDDDDLELGLSYTLIQHERMLEGARQLLHKLGQAQEALGRRLDELCLYYYSQTAERATHSSQAEKPNTELSLENDEGDDDSWRSIVQTAQECEDLFRATARELYRKQMLAQSVFDSVHDDLLDRTDKANRSVGPLGDDELGGVGMDPSLCAAKCARQWPCSSKKHSHLYVFQPLLETWKREYSM